MQQIVNFDIALNYLPYRYRHRSNTRSKRTKVSVQRKSYSRSKMQKDNAVKNIQTSASYYKINSKFPLAEDQFERNDNEVNGQNFYAMNRDYYGFDKLQYSRSPSVARRQQQQEREQTPNSQFSFSKELQLPQSSSNIIKYYDKQHKTQERVKNEDRPFPSETKQYNSFSNSSRREEQQIFNEQDLREIRQALANKIKQNQFNINDEEVTQENLVLPPIQQIEHLKQNHIQKERSGQRQKFNFDERYNRLQAMNQLSQEHYEKQRKTKIIQIMKKGQKVAQNYYNKHNKRMKDSQQQRLNSFNQNSIKPSHNSHRNEASNHSNILMHNKQVKSPPSKIPFNEEKAIQKIDQNNKNEPIASKSNAYSSSKLTEQAKQQSNNYSSLQTSSASQKQQSISSQRPIQNQGYTSYRMLKKQSSKKIQIQPVIQEYSQSQIQMKDAIKQQTLAHKRQIQKTSIMPLRQQVKIISFQQPQKVSSVLDNFSIITSNNAIQKLKQARSKQKPIINQQQMICTNKIDISSGYSHRNAPLSNGSNSSHVHSSSNNGYAINMKKRKQLLKPAQARNSEYSEKHNYPQSTDEFSTAFPQKMNYKLFQIIKEDSVQNIGSEQSYEPKYTLKKQGQFIIKIQPQHQQSQSYNNSFKNAYSEDNNQQNIKLSPQSRQQLLEAHLQLCFTPRSHNLQLSPLPSNRASQSQFSLPVSRVLSHQKDSEYKMQENDMILRMMMRDEEIGQLSSFLEAERQSSHRMNSSITQELCQIINSNQEQGSNILQNHIGGSNSSQQPSKTDDKIEDLAQINRQHQGDEIIQKDSYQINPLKENYRNFDDQILNALNMQQFQDQYSQIPSRGMEVSGGSQNAYSSSLNVYKGHFHPYSQAIRKFKHSKHNSADVRNKSINSFANTHSQSAKKRIQAPSEASKRTKSRRQMNAIRFKTRMTPI